MSVKRIQNGPRMSQAVVHGNVVYLSGQVAQESGGESVSVQTAEVLRRIDALLAEAGTSKSNLITASIWLSDISTFAEMNAVWDGWVDPQNTPARATVESKLAAPKFTVEIAVTAALDKAG